MVCIILAAGYATRLYPLTENFPKPLLKIGKSTILDMLVDDIASTKLADSFAVVTNSKFAGFFEEWAKSKLADITVVNDGTTSNENRLGAVADIVYAIKKLKLQDDLLVIAGDNVLDFSMKSFIEYSIRKEAACILRYHEPVKKNLSKSGVLVIDDSDRVLKMQEKPEKPESEWCCPPFYYYPKSYIPLIEEAVASGCSADAPGGLIEWLCTRSPVYAMKMPGKRYDVGDLEGYEKICRKFSI